MCREKNINIFTQKVFVLFSFFFTFVLLFARLGPREDAAAHTEGVPRLAVPHAARPARRVLALPVDDLTLLTADPVVAGYAAGLLAQSPEHLRLGLGPRGGGGSLALDPVGLNALGRGVESALGLALSLDLDLGCGAHYLVVGLGLKQGRNGLGRVDEPRARVRLPLAACGLDVLLHVERGSADRPAGRRLSDDDLGAHFFADDFYLVG